MAKKALNPSKSESGWKYHSFLTSAIVIILIYCIYNYVRSLENCSCVNQQLVTRIKNVELFLLITMITSLVLRMYYGIHSKSELKDVLLRNRSIMYMVALFMLVLIGSEIYLIYEVYNLRKSLPKSCDCADKWQLNLLYGQSIWYAVAIALIILSFLTMLF